MLSDDYRKTDLEKKDEIFLQFYHKNKSQIQHFVQERFP